MKGFITVTIANKKKKYPKITEKERKKLNDRFKAITTNTKEAAEFYEMVRAAAKARELRASAIYSKSER